MSNRVTPEEARALLDVAKNDLSSIYNALTQICNSNEPDMYKIRTALSPCVENVKDLYNKLYMAWKALG